MSIDNTVIPTDCLAYSDFELYYHNSGYIVPSWITQGPSPGATSFTFVMNSLNDPAIGTHQVPLGIRAVSRIEIAFDNSMFDIVVSPCALSSVSLSANFVNTVYILDSPAMTQTIPTIV